MGDSEITIARNYHVGAAGRLNLDGLPLTGAYTTYAVKAGTTNVPDYVTDSAASGTGWATGTKTYNNAVSVDPVEQEAGAHRARERAEGGLQDGQRHDIPSSPTRRLRCSTRT